MEKMGDVREGECSRDLSAYREQFDPAQFGGFRRFRRGPHEMQHKSKSPNTIIMTRRLLSVLLVHHRISNYLRRECPADRPGLVSDLLLLSCVTQVIFNLQCAQIKHMSIKRRG